MTDVEPLHILPPQEEWAARRKRVHYTQREVGARLDPPVKPRAVHRWETGKSRPLGVHARQYAALLHEFGPVNA